MFSYFSHIGVSSTLMISRTAILETSKPFYVTLWSVCAIVIYIRVVTRCILDL